MFQILLRLWTSLFPSPEKIQKTPQKNLEKTEEKIQNTMYKFSNKSQEKLATCHPDIQKIFNKVLSLGIFDLTVVEGKRSLERQKELVAEGKSKTLKSKHLTGDAIDVAIYKNGKIDWDDANAYYVLAGVVYAIAKQEGIAIRWGGNWDRDQDMNDQTFDDLVHYELD